MAVPKKKTSKSKRDMRRSHLALTPVNYVTCQNCGVTKLPHNMCNACGTYKGRQVIKQKSEEAQ